MSATTTNTNTKTSVRVETTRAFHELAAKCGVKATYAARMEFLLGELFTNGVLVENAYPGMDVYYFLGEDDETLYTPWVDECQWLG